MLPKTAYLIISCDAYSDLWDAHFRCLDEKWPDCPFPKFILANHRESGWPDIRTIKAGDDLSWSDNLKKGLDILRRDFEYVLLTFDDLFLLKEVDNQKINKVIEAFVPIGGSFIQMIPWINRPEPVNGLFGRIPPGSLYRPNCVYALWNIDVLQNLLIPGESAWQFEKNGSSRSDRYDGFYATLESLFVYRNTVIKGRIIPQDARRFQLTPSSHLQVMTVAEHLRFRLRYLAFRAFLKLVPRGMQRWVR